MIQRPDFMIVSGNGRNTGKTSFICCVIGLMSQNFPITAIKVSPHFHKSETHEGILAMDDQFIIMEELNHHGSKDTARMLNAGANRVFYIEAKDESLGPALKTLLGQFNIEGPVICESGGMRDIIDPSVFILINRAGIKDMKSGYLRLYPLADKAVMFDGDSFDFLPDKIGFDGQKWILNP